MYEYQATVVRVIDGDTVVLDIDLGFFVSSRMSCRLAGLNCRELEQPGGVEAKMQLMSLLPYGSKVIINSVKSDKYAGRFDAYLFLGAVAINQAMIDLGYAAAWNGKGPRPVPAWPLVKGKHK